MRLHKRDMLLFCKERSSQTNALYFVEFDTLDDLSPRIHRYTVGVFVFELFELGSVYRLEVLNTRVAASVLSGTYALEDADYLMLMELREMRFGANKKKHAFVPSDFYTFDETKAILSYQDPFGRQMILLLLRLSTYGAALLVPFALYFLLLYVFVMRQGLNGTAVTGPLLAIGALPFVIYLMSLLFSLSSLLFLRWPVTRYGLLKQYVLREAGKRKAIVLSKGERQRMLRTGIATLGIMLLLLVIHLLL